MIEQDIMATLHRRHGRDAASALMTILGIAAILIRKCDNRETALKIAQDKLGNLVEAKLDS